MDIREPPYFDVGSEHMDAEEGDGKLGNPL